jgi:hypothetical protein
MDHLTDQNLIDLAFELAEEGADHLAACDACQQRQIALRARLSQLDVLAGDPVLSEALVQATLRSARNWTRYGPWWLSLAALLLVGAVVAWQGQQGRRSTNVPQAGTVSQTVLPQTPVASLLSARRDRAGMGGMENDIPDRAQPPFAPASAIELVTLPRRENVQLTIYNAADLTLVREQRQCTVQKGWNWLQFMWADTRIDPTSLELTPLEQTDRIELEQLSFPPRLGQLGRWLFWSEVEGRDPFELRYLTSGLSWQAFYMGTLSPDAGRMDLRGYVRVTNQSGADYEDAQVRLVVGEVQLLEEMAGLAERTAPYGSPAPSPADTAFVAGRSAGDGMGMMGGMGGGGRAGGRMAYAFIERPKEIIKQKLSEYQLYTIEGTETLAHGESRRLESIAAADVNVVYLFKADRERYGDRVMRFLNFRNDKNHRLGDQPLPAGRVALYRRLDENGYLAYEGGAELSYIPIGQEVDLPLGPARLVTLASRLMNFRQEAFRFAADSGDLSGWDEIRDTQLEMTNGREETVLLEVTCATATPAWDIEVNQAVWQYEKLSSERFRFTADLPGRTRRTLPYTLRTFHGDRADSNPRVP